jgi:IS30 family transposase
VAIVKQWWKSSKSIKMLWTTFSVRWMKMWENETKSWIEFGVIRQRCHHFIKKKENGKWSGSAIYFYDYGLRLVMTPTQMITLRVSLKTNQKYVTNTKRDFLSIH